MFLVVKEAVTTLSIPVLPFLTVRFVIASLCFLPAVIAPPRHAAVSPAKRVKSLIPALLGAVFLSLAYVTQAYGIRETNVPNAAFLSSTYVLFAPVLAIVFLRRLVTRNEWIGALAALLGTTTLAGFSFTISNVAALLLLACSLFYACQIVAVAGRDRTISSAAFTGYQMLGVATLLLIATLVVERDVKLDWLLDRQGLLAVTYSGIVGSAFAFWLQTKGQDRVSPTQTAVLFSLEPIIASALAALLLDSRPDAMAGVGGALIVLGVYISQLPVRNVAADPN